VTAEGTCEKVDRNRRSNCTAEEVAAESLVNKCVSRAATITLRSGEWRAIEVCTFGLLLADVIDFTLRRFIVG